MQVIPASMDDAEAVIALAREMHGESNYHRLSFDPVEVRILLAQAEANPRRGLFLLLQDTLPIGMLALVLEKHLFAHAYFAQEQVLYVRAPFRSIHAAKALLHHAEDWAKSTMAQSLVLGAIASDSVDRIGNLYQHTGFTKWGNVYHKELS